MFRYRVVQILLLPISLIYGISVSLRKLLYRWDILKSTSFNLPVISVGNMSIGGTGKSPHIEYLIRMLKDHINVATLSRGYGRQSKGFRWVKASDSSLDVGDEPLQFAKKFRNVAVAVGENRVLAVVQMIKELPMIQTILLDDAYQHLAIDPGFNLLLTEYSRPYHSDILLPSGRLREWRSGASRADAVIVTKCPELSDPIDGEAWRTRLDLHPEQKLFFSRYRYGKPYFILDEDITLELHGGQDVLVVSAIANTDYLLDYLNPRCNGLKAIDFEDHHYFNAYEIGQIERSYIHFSESEKLIITTEKDATRLLLHRDIIVAKKLPIFVLPVEVEFCGPESENFDDTIKDFIREFEA